MVSLPSYGMAGIGIAAAIGFVLALSAFGANMGIVPAHDGNLQTLQQKANEVVPSDQIVGNNAGSQYAKGAERSGQPQDGATSDSRPILDSITVLSASRETIGELVPQMQFHQGSSVIIQSKFENRAGAMIQNQTIRISLRAADGQSQSYQQAANFRGDINANSSMELELYWNPDTTGEYTILLFSDNPVGTTSQSVVPIAEIPVIVVPR